MWCWGNSEASNKRDTPEKDVVFLNCPAITSKSFHRRKNKQKQNKRLSFTHSLPFLFLFWFLGNVFWILAQILCLYNSYAVWHGRMVTALQSFQPQTRGHCSVLNSEITIQHNGELLNLCFIKFF